MAATERLCRHRPNSLDLKKSAKEWHLRIFVSCGNVDKGQVCREQLTYVNLQRSAEMSPMLTSGSRAALVIEGGILTIAALSTKICSAGKALIGSTGILRGSADIRIYWTKC